MLAESIVREMRKILNDTTEMHRMWRRSFGRGHKNGYTQFSPMIDRCMQLRDEYNVLARTHEDASDTMRRVRDMMDHSDMFSLDELVCASCKAAASVDDDVDGDDDDEL